MRFLRGARERASEKNERRKRNTYHEGSRGGGGRGRALGADGTTGDRGGLGRGESGHGDGGHRECVSGASRASCEGRPGARARLDVGWVFFTFSTFFGVFDYHTYYIFNTICITFFRSFCF